MKMSKMMVSCSSVQINAEQDDISENDDEDPVIRSSTMPNQKTKLNCILNNCCILNPMTNIFVCYVLASHINDKLNF